MTTQPDVPAEKLRLLNEIVAALQDRSPMSWRLRSAAVTRAAHTRLRPIFDIGLYYFEHSPFDIEAIRKIARQFASSGEPTVTGFYDWGPFVNGGAWIDNAICKVDFLYRNLDQVTREVAEAKAGRWSHSFDQQPPFGFRSVTTLGEIHCCKPLSRSYKACLPHSRQRSRSFRSGQAEAVASSRIRVVGCGIRVHTRRQFCPQR